MYWEFEEIPVVGMSNNSEFLLSADQKDHQKMIKFGLLLRPKLEFPERCEISASDEDDDELHHQQRQNRQDDDDDDEEDRKENRKKECETLVDSSEELKLGEFKEELDDEDDGFRTPTSLDHKISVASKCPPAPRKPKPLPSRKRKACAYSSSKLRQSVQITDVSEEIELLFPPAVIADLRRKIKKVRGDDNK